MQIRNHLMHVKEMDEVQAEKIQGLEEEFLRDVEAL